MGQDQLCQKFRKCHHLGPRYDFFTKKISDLLLTRQSNIQCILYKKKKRFYNSVTTSFGLDFPSRFSRPLPFDFDRTSPQDLICKNIYLILFKFPDFLKLDSHQIQICASHFSLQEDIGPSLHQISFLSILLSRDLIVSGDLTSLLDWL